MPGYTVSREFFVKVPKGGYKNTRFADLYIKAPNGKELLIQVGKQTSAGGPIMRELKAMVDMILAGYHVKFFPYN